MSILEVSWSTVSHAVVLVYDSEVESSFVKSVCVCGKTELWNLLLLFGLNSSHSIPKFEFLFWASKLLEWFEEISSCCFCSGDSFPSEPFEEAVLELEHSTCFGR